MILMTSTLELTIETSSLELTVAMKDHIQCHAVEMNVTIVSHTFAHSIIFHTEAGFHLVFIFAKWQKCPCYLPVFIVL